MRRSAHSLATYQGATSSSPFAKLPALVRPCNTLSSCQLRTLAPRSAPISATKLNRTPISTTSPSFISQLPFTRSRFGRSARLSVGAAINVLDDSKRAYASAANDVHDSKPRKTNRLAKERSPYLLQHQYNPVDWYPWGEEAFNKARAENKPIFLSVGYSTCHWCHVMERESFESEEIAKILNEHFVSIKLDREERPDVDKIYMTYLTATVGHGGWPMSIFLTPNLLPIVGGTYFPPTSKFGRMGFNAVLTTVANLWKEKRTALEADGAKIADALKEHMEAAIQHASAKHAEDHLQGVDLDESLDSCVRRLASEYDSVHGGFTNAPKFPRPAMYQPLILKWAQSGHDRDTKPQSSGTSKRSAWPKESGDADGDAALRMLLATLRKMAHGGIYDHLGGGFHRYSVTLDWLVPHFEKMLYDQAQLADVYTTAFQISKDPFFSDVARDVLCYVSTSLTSPDEDADSYAQVDSKEKVEGAFYVWTEDELYHLLGDKPSHIFNHHYGVNAHGNVPPEVDHHGELRGQNILIAQRSVDDTAKDLGMTPEEVARTIAECKQKLFSVRNGRPRPHLDDKIITAWNAFAKAGQVLADNDLVEKGAKAARFIKHNLYDKPQNGQGRLFRAWREGHGSAAGFCEDYSFLVRGLIDLYEASFDEHWIGWALELQRTQDELFYDHKRGGYFNASPTDPTLILPVREDSDGAEPANNAVSAHNLLRLASLTDDSQAFERARQTIASYSRILKELPMLAPSMLQAFHWLVAKPKEIAIAGPRGSPDTAALLREVWQTYIPSRSLLLLDDNSSNADTPRWTRRSLPASVSSSTSAATNANAKAKATALVCHDFACGLPATTPEELRERLRS